jgi:hypothetical protein
MTDGIGFVLAQACSPLAGSTAAAAGTMHTSLFVTISSISAAPALEINAGQSESGRPAAYRADDAEKLVPGEQTSFVIEKESLSYPFVWSNTNLIRESHSSCKIICVCVCLFLNTLLSRSKGNGSNDTLYLISLRSVFVLMGRTENG